MPSQGVTRTSKACDYCGAQFNPIAYDVKRGKARFCSKKCKTHQQNKDAVVPSPIDISEDIASIDLKNGKFALVDVADLPLVADKCWRWHKNRGDYGCVASGMKLKLHRLIMADSLKEGLVVDHLNGNTLDNRRCNLRVCTQAENMKNTKQARKRAAAYRAATKPGGGT